ncbi:MAG: glycosyl hydrolase family 18 protein [Bacilli bacterium]
MKKFVYLLIAFASMFMLVGCQPTTIQSIEVDLSELPTIMTVENFEIYLIKLNVTMSDQTVKTVYADETMIMELDRLKLQSPGIHEISVEFQGFHTSFTVQLYELMTVVFLDKDGQELSEVSVPKGSDVVAPIHPIYEGYTFIGWNTSLINVQENKEIQAMYERDTVTITFYVNEVIMNEVVCPVGEELLDIPVVPEKDGFIGQWDVSDFSNIMTSFQVHAVYSPLDEQIFEPMIVTLNGLYLDKVVESDIDLMTELNGATLYWTSDHDTYLTNDGKLARPYQDTMIQMSVEMNYRGLQETIVYDFTLKGYRSLDEGIASGYVYRSYNALSDEFFDTMDIIYCAFVLIDAEGGFTGLASNNASIASSNRSFLNNMTTYVIPKSKEKGIYTVASLGGGGSVPKDTFALIAASDTLRKAFAANAVQLINEYGFDGVDVDWESPTTAEKVNFTLLMEELYTAVKQNNPNHLVTAAITGGTWQPPRYDLENSIQYLDYINVMTYGMCSSNGNYQNALYRSPSYHNTTLKVGNTLTSCSIAESVTIFNNLKVASSKLIFGLAFYGMKQTYVNGSWVGSGSVFYTAIKNTYLTSGNYDVYYDETAQVPYLLSKDNLTFVSYDNSQSIIVKCQYVLANQLAGVMYWENGCDLTGDLVHAMYVGLGK